MHALNYDVSLRIEDTKTIYLYNESARSVAKQPVMNLISTVSLSEASTQFKQTKFDQLY